MLCVVFTAETLVSKATISCKRNVSLIVFFGKIWRRTFPNMQQLYLKSIKVKVWQELKPSTDSFVKKSKLFPNFKKKSWVTTLELPVSGLHTHCLPSRSWLPHCNVSSSQGQMCGEAQNKQTLQRWCHPQRLNIDLATCNQIHTHGLEGNKQQRWACLLHRLQPGPPTATLERRLSLRREKKK